MKSSKAFPMRSTLGLLATLTVLAAPAQALTLASLPGLQQVRVWEATASLVEADFSAGDARLAQRLAGSSLTAASRDFGFFAGDENYDLFYSDANGTLNANGGYLTIEANCGVPFNCHNIDAVALQISGVSHYATAVTHVTYSGTVNFPGTEGNILGAPNNTWTALGDTIGLPADSRLSITVSFDTAPVPEPQIWGLMALGLAAIGLCLQRRR
jgi:hypothetical protein